jgi:hypothetical protein
MTTKKSTRTPKQKPASKSENEQQQKIRDALKVANQSWWILETHVALLSAAARGEGELPRGVSSETISWHSYDVCEAQFGRLNESLEVLQKLAGIDDLFVDGPVQEASQ